MILPGQSAFLTALGWALLNSLWQFGLLWIVFVLITSSVPKIAPTNKHKLALWLLSAGSFWFVTSLLLNYFPYLANPGSQSARVGFGNTSVNPASLLQFKIVLEKYLPYLSFGYLLFVAMLFTRFFNFFKRSHKLKTSGLIKLSGELRVLVLQFSEQLGISRKVQVWASEYIDTPMIIGFIKPTILIPLACLSQLSVKQLEAILLHELAHIKRNDYAINLFISFTEILFFFNPFARLFTTTVRHERENSCDDWVLQYKYNPFQYASALLLLEQNRSQWSSCGISARGDNKKTLLHRVQRIMNVKPPTGHPGVRLAAYLLLAGMLAVAALLRPSDELKNTPQGNTHFISNYLSKAAPRRTAYPAPQNTAVKQNNKQPVNTTTVKRRLEVEAVNETYVNQGLPDEYLELWERTLQSDNLNPNLATLVSEVVHEEKDFSIPEKEQPVLPVVVPTIDIHPYVPNSSFYYEHHIDTSKPKIKTETYSERTARESLTKAQKALDKLNWNKIEKQLSGKTRVDFKKLQKEIQLSLKELDWQKINEEVRTHVNNENLENIKASIKVEYDKLLQYKAQQQQLQEVKSHLEQMQQKYKEEAEKDINEIRRHVKQTKVIVYI